MTEWGTEATSRVWRRVAGTCECDENRLFGPMRANCAVAIFSTNSTTILFTTRCMASRPSSSDAAETVLDARNARQVAAGWQTMNEASAIERYKDYTRQIVESQSRWAELKEWPRGLSLLADVLGIASVVIIPFLAPEVRADALTFGLAVVAIGALGAAILLHRRNQRAVRYQRAMLSLHLAVHVLRDEAAFVTEWTDARIKACLAEVLSAFATAFGTIIGAPCRTCIKVIDFIPPAGDSQASIKPNDRMQFCYARTFCRDTATQRLIGNLPENPVGAPVQQNTDFRQLEDVNCKSFLGNNLPKMFGRGQYQNTSVNKYGGDLDSASKWSLPYKATMVWPIRVVTEAKQVGKGHFTGHQDIFGYLAVDTMVVDAFQKEVDHHVGALLADALYLFFSKVYFQREEGASDAQQTEAVEGTGVAAIEG